MEEEKIYNKDFNNEDDEFANRFESKSFAKDYFHFLEYNSDESQETAIDSQSK